MAVGCLMLMAIFIVASLSYFKRIRDGRADPFANPSWPTILRPTSPPSPLHDPDAD
ncbi:hypothetical protein [Mycobacterium sp.]|uniref:hypothetical protein n=1 Tax=Mycobacterium sp. TaxID=1785 RepID=UPI003BA901C4